MSSADYGFQKPHPAIFDAAAARLGLHPREVWFTGDDYHNDVKGARGAGMNVIWYNPSQAPPADDYPTVWVSDWANFIESVASSVESPNRTQRRDSGL
jgi:FMN phosphatase YigB (HAD superfamily)